MYFKMIRDKGYHIRIKGPIHQENITIVNIYAPIRALIHIKQKLTKLKGKINSNSVIVVNTTLSKIDPPVRETRNNRFEQPYRLKGPNRCMQSI